MSRDTSQRESFFYFLSLFLRGGNFKKISLIFFLKLDFNKTKSTITTTTMTAAGDHVQEEIPSVSNFVEKKFVQLFEGDIRLATSKFKM